MASGNNQEENRANGQPTNAISAELSTEERYSRRFCSDDQAETALVLIEKTLGMASLDEMGLLIVSSLGMVFCDRTGCPVELKPGRLEWLIPADQKKDPYLFKRFMPGQICRLKLKAQTQTDRERNQGKIASMQNTWLVCALIEPSANHPALAAEWLRYQIPVTLTDPVLGTLKLDRDMGALTTTFPCPEPKEEEVELYLSLESDQQDTWQQIIAQGHALITRLPELYPELLTYAADELTEDANEWQDSTDEEGNHVPAITKEQFQERLTLTSVSLHDDGRFSFWFDDDDMFFGHVIEVSGTLDEGPDYAAIAG